jgi:hypothetical protein
MHWCILAGFGGGSNVAARRHLACGTPGKGEGMTADEARKLSAEKTFAPPKRNSESPTKTVLDRWVAEIEKAARAGSRVVLESLASVPRPGLRKPKAELVTAVEALNGRGFRVEIIGVGDGWPDDSDIRVSW